MATKLIVFGPQTGHRWWRRRNDNVDFFGSRASWIQVPAKLREYVQFGSTIFDAEGSKKPDREFRVFGHGSQEESVARIRPYEEHRRVLLNHSTNWLVRFPKPFSSPQVVVRPWIMDINVEGGRYGENTGYHGLTLEAYDIKHETFRIRVKIPASGRLWFVRIAYVAYDASSSNMGFWAEQCHWVYGKDHPTLLGFPTAKFRRQPAIASMISSFATATEKNARVNVRYAACRDGIIVHGHSWSDTILANLSYLTLAIANE